MYDIQEYITDEGISPFRKWLEGLKDMRAIAKIDTRIDRVSLGNFGDFKSITHSKGVLEMREHYGQGYRIYYTIIEKRIVLILAGSTKKKQEKAIKEATNNLTDYIRRSTK